MNELALQKIQQTYGIENWGAHYFSVNPLGNVQVHPLPGKAGAIDLKKLIDELVKERGMTSPLVLRFPQILTQQLRKLAEAYQAAIASFEYHALHYPVFPMKVNPRREVVEQFLQSGATCRVGLECGSKAELFAAVAQEQTANSLLICNGFKDEAFLRLANLAQQSGKNVIVVIEKLNELKLLLRVADETGVCPAIGLRAKLYSRGSGKWASSGGESAKFGLTTSEIMQCLRLLSERQRQDQLKLLHFHIGSQITDIKRVKNAMKEAARVYSKIWKLGYRVEFLDIGGGLGVDYDGSKTVFESSMNYTVQEFANDVVYQILSVCDDEEVPHPNLVTESGRMMTAYHAMLVISIREEIETFADDEPEVTIDEDDPQVISELKYLYDDINGKNYVEYYHDALAHKDELHTQFNLGLISLEDRAKGEVLFWSICDRALKEAQHARSPNEEFEEVKSVLASKYLCNFSLFRSAPDAWAIRQLFPIMPLHRLHEPLDDIATLVDVTCDSDGKIDRFVDLRDVKETIELPKWRNGEEYYLGIFLVGAYQEVMGSYHNLFGIPNEAQVMLDQDGSYQILETVEGSRIDDMVAFARYDAPDLVEMFRRRIFRQVADGFIDVAEANRLVESYQQAADGSTYLE
jgi:arginine decarboxylase